MKSKSFCILFCLSKQSRKRKRRSNESTNVVIRQEVDTSFDERAQEERQVVPHFHHEGVLRFVPLRGANVVTLGAGASVLR